MKLDVTSHEALYAIPQLRLLGDRAHGWSANKNERVLHDEEGNDKFAPVAYLHRLLPKKTKYFYFVQVPLEI